MCLTLNSIMFHVQSVWELMKILLCQVELPTLMVSKECFILIGVNYSNIFKTFKLSEQNIELVSTNFCYIFVEIACNSFYKIRKFLCKI